MEEEALKLKELQSEVDKQIGVSSPQHLLDRSNSNTSINLSYEEKVHADFRNKLKYLFRLMVNWYAFIICDFQI